MGSFGSMMCFSRSSSLVLIFFLDKEEDDEEQIKQVPSYPYQDMNINLNEDLMVPISLVLHLPPQLKSKKKTRMRKHNNLSSSSNTIIVGSNEPYSNMTSC